MATDQERPDEAKGGKEKSEDKGKERQLWRVTFKREAEEG